MLPPTEGIGTSWGWGGGGSLGPKHLKKYIKLNWKFQRRGGLGKISLCVGEVWIFSGSTHCIFGNNYCFNQRHHGEDFSWSLTCLSNWFAVAHEKNTHYNYSFLTKWKLVS